MKFFIVSILTCGAIAAQTPPAPSGSKTIDIDVGKALAGKEIPPDTVVATVNGKKLTARELSAIIQGQPPQGQKMFQQNPKQFLRDYAVLKLIEAEALQNKLDEQSPYKEQIEFMKMYTLVNAQATYVNTSHPVSPEDERKFYEANKQKFNESKVKVIYVPFAATASADKKVLTEPEAKSKAEEIVKQARGGADFVKLVKEHSQEEASKAKDGDLGIPVRATTQQVPEAFRKVILAAKVGEITDPLRLDNGFYIFRIESSGVLPYAQVRDEIFKELKQAGFVKWQNDKRAAANVTFDNEEYFTPRTAQQQ